MTQTRLFVRKEVTIECEGTRASTLASGGSALPTGRRAVGQEGGPSSPSVPPFLCRTVKGGLRHRNSPVPMLCHTDGKAVDGIKLSHILSCCTQHPSSSTVPAWTGAAQPPVFVGRPWPPCPSSCGNPRQPQGWREGATSPKPPPDSNQDFRKERWPSQKAKYAFFFFFFACCLP